MEGVQRNKSGAQRSCGCSVLTLSHLQGRAVPPEPGTYHEYVSVNGIREYAHCVSPQSPVGKGCFIGTSYSNSLTSIGIGSGSQEEKANNAGGYTFQLKPPITRLLLWGSN